MALCAGLRRAVGWVLLLLMAAVFECTSTSPPGKPVLKHCQSPEKETFTCWWEPRPGEGEDTTYRLFYRKEGTSGTFECPDYHTAGKNSCFFNKKHTSIWVEYFLTVTAFNAFGSTDSELFRIDVVDIVQPNPPENVTLSLDFSEENAAINIVWNPFDKGTKSGWITLKYQLRFKKENAEWSMKDAGKETQFTLHSVNPGKLYMVQVRCAADNGKWGEWSNTTFIRVPINKSNLQHFWISVSFLSTVPFLAALCILFVKRKFIKRWLLPPVPGPKIKGVDVKLLKNGQSEEVTSALLINHSFPPMTPWKNQIEEYLLVCDDNLLLVEGQKTSNVIIISKDFHVEPNVNQLLKELNVKNDVKNIEEERIMDIVDTSKSGLINKLNTIETEKPQFNPKDNGLDVIKPTENSNYVDIQRQEVKPEVGVGHMDYSTVTEVNGSNILIQKPNYLSDSQKVDVNRQGEESLPDDYTQVKEVNSDNVVLLQDPSCRNKGLHTDCSNQETSNSGNSKLGVNADHGYVDVSAPPVM